MTEKLYYNDSMMNTFIGKVLSCEPVDLGYEVTLDKTAFFPTGGGQLADTGYFYPSNIEESAMEIENIEDDSISSQKIKVLDVYENEENIIHLVEKPLELGTKVKGIIDWEDRFYKMQHHTGEHIVSGIICSTYDFDNVGFHLGNDVVTMDFNGVLTKDEITNVERWANDIVTSNREIVVDYPSKKELETMEYRSKIEIEGQVRIVSVPNCDTCACCAPHVPTTGMVGTIKVLDAYKHRGGMRLHLACGKKALEDYQKKSEQTKTISQILSVKELETGKAVQKLNQEQQNLRFQIQRLKEQLIRTKVQEISSTIKEKEFLQYYLEDFGIHEGKELVNQLLEKGLEEVVVYTKVNEEGYQFVAGTLLGDVRYISNVLRTDFSAKGGGNAKMVQGNVVGDLESIQMSVLESNKEVKNERK